MQHPLVSLLCLALCALTIAPALAAPPPAASQPVAVELLAEFTIDDWGEPLVIPLEHDGKDSCFLVDSGATFSVLDPAYFPDLQAIDVKLNAQTSGGLVKRSLYRAPDLRVGPFLLSRCGPVTQLDLSEIRAITGRRVIGVLGFAAFNNFVFQIDYDQRRFRFLWADERPHPEWGAVVPMTIDPKQCPTISLSLGESEQRMLIDTGSSSVLSVPSPLFERMLVQESRPFITTPISTAAGTVHLRQMRVADFELAGLRYAGLLAGETRSPRGLIGLTFLKRHLVTLDFPHGRLYLKPGKEFHRSSDDNMCGLRLRRVGPQTAIQFIDPDSPAQEAGLKEDDVLLEVNGQAVEAYSMSALRNLFASAPGREIMIAYERGGERRTVRLILQRAI